MRKILKTVLLWLLGPMPYDYPENRPLRGPLVEILKDDLTNLEAMTRALPGSHR